MKKITKIAMLALAFAGFSVLNAQPVQTGAAKQNDQQMELKEGLKEGQKNGLAQGQKNGLAQGQKNGLAQGMKNGLKEGLKNGEKK